MRSGWAKACLGLLGALIVAVVVVRQVAPGLVSDRVVAGLQARAGATVRVGAVEIDYLRLAITVHDLRFDTGRVSLTVDAVDADWPWAALVRSDARPTLVVHRPRLEVSSTRSPQPTPDAPARLGSFESLQVLDGAAELTLSTPSGPTLLQLSGIEAKLTNPQFGSSQMGTRVELSGNLPGAGRVQLDGQVSSREPRQAWRLRFDVQGLVLTDFNNLWRDIVEMDVEAGTLDVRGELLRTTAHLRGRVTPRFDGLVMLEPGEDASHPMAEALLEQMLVGATSTIEINRDLQVGSTLTLSALLATDWKHLVAGLIKRGYARRLGTLDGYDAEIGDVELDFSMGLLTLFDVRLVSESRAVDIPFVVAPRIDVVFDEKITEWGAVAYKHVTLWEPTLTFVAAQSGPQSQIRFDERWVDKISALPFKTRDLVVHDGRVDYRDDRYELPVHFFVSDIELVGSEMAADLHPPGYRGARLKGSCKLMGVAEATIAVAYEPRASQANLELDLYLPPLPLEVLNPVLRTYAELEARSGALGFSANISARNMHAQASVVPTIVGPKLRGVAGARRKYRYVAIERRLKRLRGHAVELEFELEPGEGVLHEFFPAFLIAAIRER